MVTDEQVKSYADYSNEISAKELYDGLVGFGLFADKIPNFLTSESFLDFTNTITFPLCKDPKDYIRYSNIRNINVPRPMAIPEPFAYASQCKSLSENWGKLQKHFQDKTANNTFKISRIHLRKLAGKRELFKMNYTKFSEDGDPKREIIIKSRYIADADISNCFSSIYSHSIAWALVGKPTAKACRDSTTWFNQLDCYTRNVKYGETNGVLIGPHASNLISEIILTSVDYELSRQGFKYIRKIDDYTCYAESYEEAEKFFLCLSEELKKYELTLNNKKSRISLLPQARVNNWVTKLNHFNFKNTYSFNNKEAIRVKELEGFLDFVIELMLEEDSDTAIINYAIKIISSKHLGTYAKDCYIKQIHHLALLYPYLIHLLENYIFKPHQIDKEIIKRIARDIYHYGMQKKVYEACSFGLYWALRFDFDIEITTLKDDSIKSLDCIFMLISYLYDKKHSRKAYLKEYKDKAKDLKKDDFDRYWLFIYETLSWTDLPGNYKAMKKSNLTFIKPDFI